MSDYVLDKLIEQSITCSYLDTKFEDFETLHDTLATYLNCTRISNTGPPPQRDARLVIVGDVSTLTVIARVRLHVMLARICVIINEPDLARAAIVRVKDVLSGAGAGTSIGALAEVVRVRAEVEAAVSGDAVAEAYVRSAGAAVVRGGDGFDLTTDDLWLVGDSNSGGGSERVLDGAGGVSEILSLVDDGRLREALWVCGRVIASGAGGGGPGVAALWALRGRLCVLVGVAEGRRENAGAGPKAVRAWKRAGRACFLRALEVYPGDEDALRGLSDCIDC